MNLHSYIKSYLNLCRTSPSSALTMFLALMRGSFAILNFKLTNPKVRIRWPFFVYEKFSVSGPGSVFIDESCAIFPNTFKGVSIVTLSPHAIVRIGRNSSLGGLTIRCRNSVEIGERALTGHSLIQDTLFSECPDPESRPDQNKRMIPTKVIIGKNVWIGSQCCILPGTSIDDHSVLSSGSSCSNMNIKPYHLASGNLCSRAMPISKLLNFSGFRQDSGRIQADE